VLESPLAQELIAEQRPLLLSNIQEQAGDRLLGPVSDWASCGMAAPLGVRQSVVGLLLLYSRMPQSYSEQEAALLLALANQAAVGVENARLYEQAQTLATVEERQRLARELHDAVSQTLFSANIMAEALPRIWEQNPEGVRRRLPELHRLTSGALAEMRTLLLELRPSALVEIELGELLQQAVSAFSGRSRTKASLRLVGRRPLPVPVQLGLYRIAQEGLNNVAKHARAEQVELFLQMEPDRVELRIRDNGRGFDPESVPAGCMGLSILRERARAIDAGLEVTSQPGEGTEIVAIWTEPI
jgi:two-component system nitrate/nitrite sensor histidine kinase NarX